MSYEGLESAVSEQFPHLGGNAKAGDPFSYCPSAWDYVLKRFGISSVLDIGSGCGNASDYFFNRGKKVIAIDGLERNIEKSLYPVVQHDLTKGPVITKVDLVHCQEVVEHIAPQFLNNLIRSLKNGKFILMTHALPGQTGHHHVNEQPTEYWVQHLQAAGCTLLVEDTKRVRILSSQDGATYMTQSGLLFANSARL